MLICWIEFEFYIEIENLASLSSAEILVLFDAIVFVYDICFWVFGFWYEFLSFVAVIIYNISNLIFGFWCELLSIVSNCSKTLLKLTIPRIKLLRNRREIQIKQMRRDIAKLLETGQEATARIRVETVFILV